MNGGNNLRKWSILALVLLVSLCGAGGGSASAASLPGGGGWADATLQEWSAKGLLHGDPNGSLQADRRITRAEFMALINRAFGFSARGAAGFADVSASAWYAADVAAAAEAGYASGYADGTIRPGRAVTRQEAAVMLAKVAGIRGISAESGAGDSRYSDAGAIGAWSLPSVETVNRLDVMKGYADGTFGPNALITRAEAVVSLDRLMKLQPTSNDVVYDEAGIYGSAAETTEIQGDVAIRTPGVTLRNVRIQGDLILEKGIGEGDATLDNVTVEGDTLIAGGGEHSVYLINSVFGAVMIEKEGAPIRIVAEGNTQIAQITVRSETRLELGSNSVVQVLVIHAVIDVAGDGRIVRAELYVSGAAFEKQPEQVSKEEGVDIEVGGGTGGEGDTGSGGSSGSGTGGAGGTGSGGNSGGGTGGAGGTGGGDSGGGTGGDGDTGGGDSGGGTGGDGDTGGGDSGGGSGSTDQAPVIAGVVNGEIYTNEEGVVPTSADTDIEGVTLMKDGEAIDGYALGTPIRDNGSYVLTVTDAGGHSTTVSFTIAVPLAAVEVAFVPGSIESVERELVMQIRIENRAEAIDDVVQGIRLNVPGADRDELTGWDGYGYVNLTRVGESDDFVGYFPSTYDWGTQEFVIEPYRLDSGATRDVDFSVQLGAFTEPKTVKVRFWIAEASQPDEDNALYGTEELTLPLEANHAPITDLEVVETTGRTVTLRSTFPEGAYGFSVGYGFRAPDANGSWEYGANPGLDDIRIDEQTGKAELTLTLPHAGYTYQLQMEVFGGKHDGPSNIVSVDLYPQIDGVEDGATYEESKSPSALGDYDTVLLTRDGGEVPGYALDTPIEANGDYVLSVQDGAQRSTVRFRVAIPVPAPVVTGIMNGMTYKAAVTPNSTDDNIVETILTKDGSPIPGYALGTPISANGMYELTVKNGAGKETAIAFTVAISPVQLSIIDHSYEIATGEIKVRVRLHNTGDATIRTAATGVQVTMPEADRVNVVYSGGRAGLGFAYMYAADESDKDTLIVMDEDYYRLAAGTDTILTYSISIGNRTAPSQAEMVFWVGDYSQPGRQDAFSETLPIVIDMPANYIGILDIAANGVTDRSAKIEAQYPSGMIAAWVHYDKVEDNVTIWSAYNSVHLTDIPPDANGRFSTSVTFNEPGETYYVRLRIREGMYRGFSQVIVVDLAPALQNVANGAVYETEVSPASTNADIASVLLIKDGTEVPGYSLGDSIVENGAYVLTVTDAGGRSTTVAFAVAIA